MSGSKVINIVGVNVIINVGADYLLREVTSYFRGSRNQESISGIIKLNAYLPSTTFFKSLQP